MTKNTPLRLWEIDFLRGIAIILMLTYHFLVDLEILYNKQLNLDVGFWRYFQKTTASLFLILAGISLTISYCRTSVSGPSFRKYLKRGCKIFLWGVLITFATRRALGDGYVIFGILHLIGLSIILAFPLLRFKLVNLLLGIGIIFIGFYLEKFTLSTAVFVWLGLTPNYFYSVDYFPLFPWFGLILTGIFFGQSLYPQNNPIIKLKDYSLTWPMRILCAMGKRSLTIYLIHQPLFLTGLYLWKRLF